MSANIDTMLYVGETPWHNQGVKYETPPKSSFEIVEGAKLNWNVASIKMKTDMHDSVLQFNAIYREDTGKVLGAVNRAYPKLVQNREMFNSVEHLIGKDIETETAASLGDGEKVFGCFRIHEQYKLLDDDVDHYFLILNDHLRVDGKVTVLNTPVRVVCQNTLSEALSNNIYKVRVPISAEASINQNIADNLLYGVDNAIRELQRRSEDMIMKKVDTSYMEKLLNILYPYKEADGQVSVDRANERIEVVRSTFMNCMDKDDLQNFKGTQWQVLNALVDFNTHYFRNVDKAYDINYRMKLIPGISYATEPSDVVRFLKIADTVSV